MLHLFPNGSVELGTGGPGYRWSPAYSQILANGVSQPLNRRHWYNIARKEETKCKFYENENDAREGFKKDPNT
jgi:hypothetical protein